MKIPYQQPETQALTLFTRSSVLLEGSNEGYQVDPFDPGFSPKPQIPNFSSACTMNRRFTIAALAAVAALAVFSCAKQDALVPEPETPRPADPWTIVPEESFFVGNGNLSVSAEYSQETKSQLVLNDAGTAASITWTAGDKIYMQDKVGYSTTYTASSSGAKVNFSGGATLPAGDVYHSIYPSSAYKFRSTIEGARVFMTIIPESQAATIGSVAEGANLSYARSASQDEDLDFKNFVSIIKFRLSGEIVSSVKQVSIQGTQSMSGDILLKPDSEGTPTVLRGWSFGGSEDYTHVSLAGSFEAGKDYYIAAAPGVHNGFIMTFLNEDGTQRIKKVSSKTLTLDRSRIKDFGTINLGSSWDDPSSGPQPYIKHTVTPYATIAVVPDGYTEAELNQYELDAKAGIDALFNTEPYKSYKSHFNVWILKVASNESGARVSDGTPEEQNRDCYFESSWGKDENNYGKMNANRTKVFSFVSSHCPDIQDGIDTIKDVPVLIIINDNRYGGIAINSPTGETYCMVPKAYDGAATYWSYPYKEAATFTSTPPDTRTVTEAEMAEIRTNIGTWHNTLVHEFGGHSIGRLGDEYWYDSKKDEVSSIASHTWPVPMRLNVSATHVANQTPWAGLFDEGIAAQMAAKSPLYGERIGVFQGADVSMFYRWRSERISCMIDNRFYFSTWQRYLIVNRIMTLAGLPSKTLAEFLENDVPEDPVRDIVGSPVINPHGVSFLPPRPVPMLTPPIFVQE